jgi:hypothetical protein
MFHGVLRVCVLEVLVVRWFGVGLQGESVNMFNPGENIARMGRDTWIDPEYRQVAGRLMPCPSGMPRTVRHNGHRSVEGQLY